MPGLAIGLRPKWSPGLNCQVDYAHPIAGRLICAYTPVAGLGAVDLCGNQLLPSYLTPDNRAGGVGREMYGNAVNAGAKTALATASPMRTSPPTSVMWVGTVITPNASQGTVCFGMLHADTDISPWAANTIVWTSAGAFEWEGNDGTNYQSVNSGAVSNGPHVVVGTASSAGIAIWVDGKMLNSSATAISSITYHSTTALSFHYYPSFTQVPGVSSGLGCMWGRVLSATEIAALAVDPFCFLKR